MTTTTKKDRLAKTEACVRCLGVGWRKSWPGDGTCFRCGGSGHQPTAYGHLIISISTLNDEAARVAEELPARKEEIANWPTEELTRRQARRLSERCARLAKDLDRVYQGMKKIEALENMLSNYENGVGGRLTFKAINAIFIPWEDL